MNKDDFNPICDIPVAELGAIASRVLDTEAVAVGTLSTAQIGRSNGQTTVGIYRVVGLATTSAGEQTWSAVAKVLKVPENLPPDTEAELSRELTVYRSGVFADLCGGVRSARCYAVQERNDLQLLWLEDLSAAPQAPWMPKYYLETARHLGQFNAHWTQQTLPEWAWLSRESFRQKFKEPWYQAAFEQLATRPSEPLINRVAPPAVANRLMKLWNESDALFAQVEATSKGICHLDCHPKNLFPIGSSTAQAFTMAIDWAAVGIGCLGIDIGHLLASPMTWLELPLDQAAMLVEPVFAAYLAGLKEAGWTGNEAQVRLTYFTRLGCESFRMLGLTVAAADDSRFLARLEKFLRAPIEEICTQWAMALRFFLDNADEALLLADQL